MFGRFSKDVATKFDKLPSEARLLVYAIGLYVTFMFWGYLQEKITSSAYKTSEGYGQPATLNWNGPFVLNFGMALFTCVTAYIIETNFEKPSNVSTVLFWRPALSATLASPIGYESLKYVNYPLMVLTKSSKPVPVMVVGTVFYKQVYPWFKYISVAFLCLGITLFTLALGARKQSSASNTQSFSVYGILYVLYGLLLILVNLLLDGYTNNEQDRLYSNHPITAVQMMKHTNLWQCIYQAIFLVVNGIVYGSKSQVFEATRMLRFCPALRVDMLAFCMCAAVGQVLVFKLIKEYGSLVWITISVTRQLFTIILSVLLFGHAVNMVQWLGVVLVFTGLSLEILLNFIDKNSTEKWDGTAASMVQILSKISIFSAAVGDSIATRGIARPASVTRISSFESDTSDIEQHSTPDRVSGRKKATTPGAIDWDKRKAD